MKRVNYVIANWKMNGLRSHRKLYNSINKHLVSKKSNKPNVIICPPHTLIHTLALEKKSQVKLGAQDAHQHNSGAFTGCISSEMIKDSGAEYVIIGHSERRQYFNESTKLIADKIKTAHKLNLKVILCIGELKSEIRNRKKVLRNQLKSLPLNPNHKNLIIAYEPVRSIGTGLTPSLLEIDEIHSSIRSILKSKLDFSNKVSILYGGSVNAKNAKEILSLKNVDGALVGGASLQISEFSKIIDYS